MNTTRKNEEIQLTFDLPATNLATLTQQGSVLTEDKLRNPARYYDVVKSNRLIREARYFLPALQQRLLLLFISKIQPDDTQILTYEIPLREIAETLGLSITGGSVYARIRKSLKALRDSSWFIRNGDGETLFAWLDTYTYSRGIVTVKLSESLRPYLLAQSRDFTRYQLLGALALKSKYSIRLYELLMSDAWKKRPVTYSVDGLREIFAEQGKLMAYKNFKKLVITSALDEINRVTNITVSCEETRTAGGVRSVTFHVAEKDSLSRLAADINAYHVLSEDSSPADWDRDAMEQIIGRLPERDVSVLRAITSCAKAQESICGDRAGASGNYGAFDASGCIRVNAAVDDLLTASGNYGGLLKSLDNLCDMSWSVRGCGKMKRIKLLYEYEIHGAVVDLLTDERLMRFEHKPRQ